MEFQHWWLINHVLAKRFMNPVGPPVSKLEKNMGRRGWLIPRGLFILTWHYMEKTCSNLPISCSFLNEHDIRFKLMNLNSWSRNRHWSWTSTGHLGLHNDTRRTVHHFLGYPSLAVYHPAHLFSSFGLICVVLFAKKNNPPATMARYWICTCRVLKIIFVVKLFIYIYNVCIYSIYK